MALVDTTGDSTLDAWPTVQARRGRRRFASITIFTALALIAGVVFVAVTAEGREISRASSNDGGAWLVNRELAVVGHKNRAAGEISASIRVADSPTADIFQADGVVVVHDVATGQLLEVDERAFAEDQQPTQLPEFTSVRAIDNGVLIVRNDPLSVWQVDMATLRSLATLDGVPAIATSRGSGMAAATASGSIAVFDAEGGQLLWFDRSAPVGEPIVVAVSEDVVDLTIVGEMAVLLLDNGDLLIVGREGVERSLAWSDIGGEIPPLARLQQATDDANSFVAGVTSDGDLVSIGIEEVATVEVRASLGAAAPLAPIVHDGCTHLVTTEPPVYGVVCGNDFGSRPLAGASQELRLRLVNGSVWVNDLEDGGVWITDDDLQVQRIDDWSLVAETESDASDSDEDAGGNDSVSQDEVVVEDPDALGEVQSSDDFNLTETNVAPVAVDDQARTRVDRTTVIEVLDNDFDANNDILIVVSAELITGDARVNVTPSGEQVQVTPAPGFVGVIEFTYAISDGEADPVSALVRVEVLPTEATNTPPVAVTDVVATAPGNSTTIDVLYNDTDADGDALALSGIGSETGTLRWDPTGQVTFTPDNNTEAGWIELPYVVRDDRGAESQGLLRVEIRDSGANQEPDARNDHASTIVGRPVVINLLANDSDPDGDPLIVGSRPVLLEPENAVVQVSTTSDGEFVFAADIAGTYLFSYTVTDSAVGGSESDTAQIRVDVIDNPVNEPPIAVRDDVVIPVAGTRSVYALENDGDPSGDVVAIVDWQPAQGLSIVELIDGAGVVGFLVTALPGAPQEVSFNYWISDGVNDPVSAPVVVVVVEETPADQPPFAVDDVVEARVGSTIQRLPVLANDFDPEGGALRIVSVGTADQAAIAISPDAQTLAIDIAETAVASFSVPYDIEDQAGNRASAIARVQLLSADAPNRPPTARTDEGRIQMETTATIDVLANDSDPDADLISLEGIVQQPANGAARVGPDGVVIYQPDAGFTGTDHIRYAIVDSKDGRDIGDIFIGVMERPASNRPPIANDDASELFGVPSITPLDVLANDSDPDGDPIRVVAVTQPDLGSVKVDAFGRVEYTPPARLDEAAAAVFTYTIGDNAGNTDSATVTVLMDPFESPIVPEQPEEEPPEPEETPEPEIIPPEPTPTPEPPPEEEPENEPPVAINDDRGPVAAGSQVVIEVLENDFDPDGENDELTIVNVDDAGGRAFIEGDTVVIVVDDVDMSVTYTIEDALGGSATAEITVFVTENQAPVVEPFETVTPYETALRLDLTGQAFDADDDQLFFGCCENIRGGEIRDVSAGEGVLTLTFIPDDRFIGGAGFSYSVDDQMGHQTAGSVSVEVRAPDNQPPETIADSIIIPQGTFRRVELTELATDPDTDPLTFSVLEQPGSGITVEIEDTVAIIDVGVDVPVGVGPVLVYEAFDGLLASPGEIAIEVTPIGNEAPVTQDVQLTLPAGTSEVINLALTTTDVDVADPTSWSIDPGAFGRLRAELNGSSLQVFAPADSAGDVVDAQYTATDSRGESSTSSISVIVVEPSAAPPVARDDDASTMPGVTVLMSVLENDVDPLGQGLNIISATTDDGIATIAGERISFTPAAGLTGDGVITYEISDAAGRLATAVVTVTLVDEPDQPSPPDVARGNEQVIVSWTTPNRNGSDLLGYRITRFSEGLTPETETVAVQNSYIWEELENGVEYTFTVIAFNGVGDSIPSEPSVGVTPDLVPEIPAAPQVAFGDELITVTWVAPPDNGGTPADRYQLEIGGALSDVVELGDVLTHPWEGLENGSEYNFRVSAGNDAGFSDFSAASPTENPETTPGVPTITSVTQGSTAGSLVIEWTAPVDDGGGTIDNYRIIPTLNGVVGEAVVTGDNLTTYPWLDLENGGNYTFQMQARNRAGWSTGLSNVSPLATPCAAPDAPVWISATRLDGAAQLVFEEPNLNGCGFTGYVITSTDLTTDETQVKNTQLTSFPFGDLENGERYTFQVAASNSFGTGPPSVASVEVSPAGEPQCGVGDVTATATGVGEITVSWPVAIGNGRAVTYEMDQGTGFEALPDPGPFVIYTGLPNSSLYDFSVRAATEVGTTATCGSASAVTWGLPTAINGSYEWEIGTQTLTWTLTGGESSQTPVTTWRTVLQGSGTNGILTCESPYVLFGSECKVNNTGTDQASIIAFTCPAAPVAVNVVTHSSFGITKISSCTYPAVEAGSAIVVAGPFERTGTGPLPLTQTDIITTEANYQLYVEVCNVVGCVESGPVANPPASLTTPKLSLPGRPAPMTLSLDGAGTNVQFNPLEQVDNEFAAWTFFVRVFYPPQDNGSPLTRFLWEWRVIDPATGEVQREFSGDNGFPSVNGPAICPVSATVFEDPVTGECYTLVAAPPSGDCLPPLFPEPSVSGVCRRFVALQPGGYPSEGVSLGAGTYPGFSTHPRGVNSGQLWTSEARVASENALGQSDWSPWVGVSTRGSDPIVEIQSSVVEPSCSFGDLCYTFTGFISYMAEAQNYSFELINIEDSYPFTQITPGVSVIDPARLCIGNVFTSGSGAAPFTVTCDVGTNATYVRLLTDEGYISGGSQLLGQDQPDTFWHLLPG